MRFSFVISHVPGRELYTADILSLAPVADVSVVDDLTEKISAFGKIIMQSFPPTYALVEIKQHQLEDETIREITKICEKRMVKEKKFKRNSAIFFAL